mmetsp:Transcript_28242/g.45713  ORF Transcript_28242/g.45713 Transcript_28242/m.45713 type:complete len:311 (-) Transcript_28242:3252-4184(-)
MGWGRSSILLGSWFFGGGGALGWNNFAACVWSRPGGLWRGRRLRQLLQTRPVCQPLRQWQHGNVVLIQLSHFRLRLCLLCRWRRRRDSLSRGALSRLLLCRSGGLSRKRRICRVLDRQLGHACSKRRLLGRIHRRFVAACLLAASTWRTLCFLAFCRGSKVIIVILTEIIVLAISIILVRLCHRLFALFGLGSSGLFAPATALLAIHCVCLQCFLLLFIVLKATHKRFQVAIPQLHRSGGHQPRKLLILFALLFHQLLHLLKRQVPQGHLQQIVIANHWTRSLRFRLLMTTSTSLRCVIRCAYSSRPSIG